MLRSTTSALPHRLRLAFSGVMACFTSALTGPAAAQLAESAPLAESAQLDDGIAVGAWTFYPSVAMRLRASYWGHPPGAGGAVYASDAVQADGVDAMVPPTLRSQPAVDDQWLLAERTRLGLDITRGVVAARIVLQDARLWGRAAEASSQSGGAPVGATGGFGIIEPYEAYLTVRTDLDDPWLLVRAGRQVLRWGDGRLLGDDDWSDRGRAFDALRAQWFLGEVELDSFAALLAAPGTGLAGEATSAPDDDEATTGAQLYGVRARYALAPLLQLDLSGLARFVREPVVSQLHKGDTYTVDLRVHGSDRGLEYALEGAYQLGRVAGYGDRRSIAAYAVAASSSLQTALPWHLRFGLRASYASGDDPSTTDRLERFDPIAPTSHEHHGAMDLRAWSNNIDGGMSVSARPHDALTIALGYGVTALAEPGDRWVLASLQPVGAAADNDERFLGHEIDASLVVQAFDWFALSTGYGLFVSAEGSRAVRSAAARGDADAMHFGYLQAELNIP